jgi:GNAT superfamily N-acetyltransferase
MQPAPQTLSVPVLSAALEGNLAEFLTHYGKVPGVRIHQDATVTWVLTGIREPFFNAVVRTDLPPGHLDAAIAVTLAPFVARRVPMLWWVTPSTRPAGLGARLESHGLTYRGEGPGMAVNLRALPEDDAMPAGFAVEEVTDVVTLLEWIRTNEEAYDPAASQANITYVAVESALGFGAHQPYRRFLGRLNGAPVATAALFLGAGVAGIYAVACLGTARRRGIGSAISLAVLREARALGYRAAVLESSPSGFNVYSRLGFRECCRLRSYIWTPPM